MFNGDGNSCYLGPLPPDCKCGKVHAATKKDRRSQRSLHKSFVTEPFRKTIIQWAMRRVLKLALDDRDKVSAQHEDSE